MFSSITSRILKTNLVLLTTSATLVNAFSSVRKTNSVSVVSWNIAAVNNNPFEYWIKHEDSRYNELMNSVETFMSDPSKDIPIEHVFSQEKYNELETLLSTVVTPELLKDLRETRWPELKKKKIVSGFLKDAEIGKKRLASMPDRLTNTIVVNDKMTLFRPTPINCYPLKFQDFNDWWKQWKYFMFETKLAQGNNIISILKKIPRSKYPELTEDDERLSVPLQIFSIAIFDAILIHMLDLVGKNIWQDLRHEMCNALNLKKNERVLEILQKTYSDADVICLQEVGQSFARNAKNNLENEYWTIIPSSAKAASRDQNSVILLRKSIFNENPVDVSSKIDLGGAAVEEGDLLVVETRINSNDVVIASFHGDTDGLATIPVLQALIKFAQGKRLIFGLDANAYNKFKKGKQLDVREFNQEFLRLKLTSCWGNNIDPTNFTTFNARTFLQPQLNKAANQNEFMEKGDVNPKDFILTFEDHGSFSQTSKDNTGKRNYIEGMVFPTLSFPSDHGVISTVLTFKEGTQDEL